MSWFSVSKIGAVHPCLYPKLLHGLARRMLVFHAQSVSHYLSFCFCPFCTNSKQKTSIASVFCSLYCKCVVSVVLFSCAVHDTLFLVFVVGILTLFLGRLQHHRNIRSSLSSQLKVVEMEGVYAGASVGCTCLPRRYPQFDNLLLIK